MRIVAITLLCVFSFFGVFAQRNPIVIKLVGEGIVLHDKGEYEAAIEKYDKALILDPNDFDANYEKSSSCLFAKKYDECIALSKYLIQYHKNEPAIKGVWVNYGSAYDDRGDADSALIIYNEGLKLFPDFYLLHYNSGLTYARQKKWDDAMDCFMQALKYKPNHSGALYYTSLLQEKSNKVAAIIGSLTFLAVEPEGKRAKAMYEYVIDMFNSFAVFDKKGNSTITINGGDLGNSSKENNFSTVEMMLGITAASHLKDSLKSISPVEKLQLNVQSMIATFPVGEKKGKGIYWKTYVPFFIEMDSKGFLNVFAHLASITSGNEENVKWIGENQDQLKAFYAWFNAYKWK